MIYNRTFKINDKKLERFTSGKVGDFILHDEESGKEFKSFIAMLRAYDMENSSSDEYCMSSQYHRYSPFCPFVYTDGVSDFCKDNESYWLLDLIGSIFPYLSKWLIKFQKDGRFEQIENARGVDDFLTFYVKKLSDNTALFCADCLDYETGEEKTCYIQYIPFTDLKKDSLMWFGEYGVLMFPAER